MNRPIPDETRAKIAKHAATHPFTVTAAKFGVAPSTVWQIHNTPGRPAFRAYMLKVGDRFMKYGVEQKVIMIDKTGIHCNTVNNNRTVIGRKSKEIIQLLK